MKVHTYIIHSIIELDYGRIFNRIYYSNIYQIYIKIYYFIFNSKLIPALSIIFRLKVKS